MCTNEKPRRMRAGLGKDRSIARLCHIDGHMCSMAGDFRCVEDKRGGRERSSDSMCKDTTQGKICFVRFLAVFRINMMEFDAVLRENQRESDQFDNFDHFLGALSNGGGGLKPPPK